MTTRSPVIQTEVTKSVCPSNVLICSPVFTFHKIALPSTPVAIFCPSSLWESHVETVSWESILEISLSCVLFPASTHVSWLREPPPPKIQGRLSFPKHGATNRCWSYPRPTVKIVIYDLIMFAHLPQNIHIYICNFWFRVFSLGCPSLIFKFRVRS